MRIITPGALCLLGLLCVTLWAPTAYSYQSYDDGTGTGCVQCHPLFSGGPQRVLHAVHQSNFGITECNLCHTNGGGSLPVLTYSSGPGGGLGCAGCHGRDYGEVSPNSGQPKATAYGLRQHHANNGVTVCATCHVAGQLGHPNPLPAIQPENVRPPYYATSTNNLRGPCDSGQEDSGFDADLVGLDNDGDGAADWPADADCPATTTTTTSSSTTSTTLPLSCGASPMVGCEAAGKGKILVDEKKTGKEKVKVGLKKLQSAIVLNDFGSPISGGTTYALCIYNDLDALVAEMLLNRSTMNCGSPPKSCWKALSTKGFKYNDKDASTDGISKLIMKSGNAGKGKIIFMGKNDSNKGLSSLPTGTAAQLLNNNKATVQLLSSDASCFAVTAPGVKSADGSVFKASGP